MPDQFLTYAGLRAPLCVVAPQIVRPLLDPVMAAWPCEVHTGDSSQTVPPFATLRPMDGGKWHLDAPLAAQPTAHHEPIDAICDLVVEMSWERLRSQSDLLCLHAAAIVFAGQLVLFPNARRAGKSLLTATLATLGHTVFSDDFVPLSVGSEDQTISGIANGIAPRLRLPLPPNMPPDLSALIEAGIRPANKRYGYLTGIDLPASGTVAPVGAVVVLDRQEDRTAPATLAPITDDEAIAALVLQNFGRQVHSGAILSVIAAIARSVPVMRLSYSGVAEAAELLHQSPILASLVAAKMPPGEHLPTNRLAPIADEFDLEIQDFNLTLQYAQCDGCVEVATAEAQYVADPKGLAIHRFNAVSALIWAFMGEAMCVDDLVDVMRDLFADVPREQLLHDATMVVKFLLSQHLIEAQCRC